MEKRVLLAIFLSFLVLYIYQALFAPPTPAPATAGKLTPAPATAPKPESKLEPEPLSPSPVESPNASMATPVVSDSNERDIRIETNDLVAVFTNKGARLKSWRLKRYTDRVGAPVELVANDLGEGNPLPFSIKLPQDAAMSSALNNALYAVSGAPASSPIDAPIQLTFEYTDSTGVQARKTFQLEPSSYVIAVSMSVNKGDQALPVSVDWGPALGDKDGGSGSSAVAARGLFSIADDVTRLTPQDAAGQATHQGDFQYAGVDDHYFMTVALSPGPSTISYQAITIPASEGEQTPPRQLMAYALDPGVRDRGLRFYFGPKDFEVLESVDRSLVRAIDFGMFAVIVVPLLSALNWIYGFVGNYGWAIIALTLVINVLMFPLRHKQVVSMRKMQEIQPEVKAIQERYAKFKTTDPAKQKMNEELMALYRERGVNPAAGCLPMLLPLPVFFAFYALLYGAIELRGAPFVGWIQDLSRPDPLYITPILMVVTQVLQTWMMPAAGTDPMQQKMMMIMPIVLGFIFLSMPAGVVIYWVVNNIWGIGQQIVTNRLIGPPNIRSPRPAAERRVKRAGSGRTDAAKEQ